MMTAVDGGCEIELLDVLVVRDCKVQIKMNGAGLCVKLMFYGMLW